MAYADVLGELLGGRPAPRMDLTPTLLSPPEPAGRSGDALLGAFLGGSAPQRGTDSLLSAFLGGGASVGGSGLLEAFLIPRGAKARTDALQNAPEGTSEAALRKMYQQTRPAPGAPGAPGKPGAAAPPGAAAQTGYNAATAAGGVGGIQLGGLGPGQKDEFYRRAMALGQQIERDTGIPAEVFAAVTANESNYGNTPGNVLFGVKAGPGEPYADLQTWEMVNGVRTPMSQRFRTYPTAYDAAQHFVGLMQNERYGPALQALRAGQVDPAGFVQRVNAAGYATNPNWHREIATRMAEAAPYRNDPGTQALLNPVVAPAIAQGLEPRPQTAIGTQVRSDTAQRVLANADTWIASNPRYEMIGGATNRQVADCSGFIVGVMNELGIPFRPGVRTAEQIRQVSTSVPRDQAQPGDLVFFQQTYEGMPAGVASHVGIVTGNGIMLDTGGNGLNYRSFQTSGWQSKLLEIRRPPQYGQ